MYKQLINNILKEIKIEALDLFDRNFESKSFFGDAWKESKRGGQRGSLLQRSGKLRRSLRGEIRGYSVVISSNMPYADIHNQGGTIVVTAKMKRYFWAKYYELMGKTKFNIKSRKATKASQRLLPQAEAYKAMALMKVGSKITIPQRQFVGDHQKLTQAVNTIIDLSVEDHLRSLFKQR